MPVWVNVAEFFKWKQICVLGKKQKTVLSVTHVRHHVMDMGHKNIFKYKTKDIKHTQTQMQLDGPAIHFQKYRVLHYFGNKEGNTDFYLGKYNVYDVDRMVELGLNEYQTRRELLKKYGDQLVETRVSNHEVEFRPRKRF